MRNVGQFLLILLEAMAGRIPFQVTCNTLAAVECRKHLTEQMNGKDPLIALAVYSQISNNAVSKTIKNKLHIPLVVQLPTRCWDQPALELLQLIHVHERAQSAGQIPVVKICETPTRGYSFTQRLLPLCKYFLAKIDAVMPAKSRNFWIHLKLKEDWNFYAFSCLKCRWSIFFFSILKYFQRSLLYF